MSGSHEELFLNLAKESHHLFLVQGLEPLLIKLSLIPTQGVIIQKVYRHGRVLKIFTQMTTYTTIYVCDKYNTRL